ncbi:MAG: helix-turn-helix domain-containing protein [Cyanobacteria bacterium P01_D01_bin.73]
MVSSSPILVDSPTIVPVVVPSTPNPDPPKSELPLRSPQNPSQRLAQDYGAVDLDNWEFLDQIPSYQQILNQLTQGTDAATTGRLLRTLAHESFRVGLATTKTADGDRKTSSPKPSAVKRPVAKAKRSPPRLDQPAKASTAMIHRKASQISSPQTPSILTLDTELREMEQCTPDAVGLWTASPAIAPSAPPPNPPASVNPSTPPTQTMSSASYARAPFAASFANPFDVPELLGQILIDVPRKVAQPIVWGQSTAGEKAKPSQRRNRKRSKKRDKVTHHHHHFQIAADRTERSRRMDHSDYASQDKEFYDSDSAVFHRSAVPAISPTLDPVKNKWESHLQQVGRYFQTERRRRGMSLATLSSRTYIPLHHLVALESGTPQQLPQAIYVKGFIQRIAQDLGLDAAAIEANMPPLPEAAVVPDWLQHSSKPTAAGLSLKSWHLYVGYSAVLAGSLAWVAQDLQTSQTPAPLPEPASQEAASQENVAPEVDVEQDLSSLAPPEAIQ